MIYITQLIYVNEGKELLFNEFEAIAIPLIAKHGGTLLLRTKPGAIVAASMEIPYEIHFISFPDEENFQAFMKDEERKRFLEMKEQSVRESILISGTRIG